MSVTKNNVTNLLNQDNQHRIKKLFHEVLADIVMFDGDVKTQHITELADLAKAFFALQNHMPFQSQDKKKYSGDEIISFINQHREAMQELTERLEALGETDLHQLMDQLGKALYQNNWSTMVVDPDKIISAEEKNKIVLYKAKNGELAVRFKNKEDRDQFYKHFTPAQIPGQFRIGPQYEQNKAGYTPVIYPGQDNRLFFPSYQAMQGEFGINCGHQGNRDLLLKLLGLKISGTKNHPGEIETIYADHLFRTYSNPRQLSAIYFNSSNELFTKPGTFLKVNTATGQVNQSKIKDYEKITANPDSMHRRAPAMGTDVGTMITAATTTSRYTFICSDATLSKIKQYRNDLSDKKVTAGLYLQQKLVGKNLKTMSDEQFIECLVQTKPDQIFAESTLFKANLNWNEMELSLLGDMSCVIPAKAYDNGDWSNPVNHVSPLDVILVYVPGPLLRSDYPDGAKPDLKEVTPNGNFNSEACYHLLERRLLPGLLHVNALAAAKKEPFMVTLPGIGCGQFSGNHAPIIHHQFEMAMVRLLTEHGSKLPQIKAIWYDNFNREPATRVINGIDFLTRPLSKGGLPQLCAPAQYGAKYANYKLASFVAWDHVSKPGNDYWGGARATDDGVKGAATDTMPALTGIAGYYDPTSHRVVPKEAPGKTWSQICKEKGGVALRVVGNFHPYPLVVSPSNHTNTTSTHEIAPTSFDQSSTCVFRVAFNQEKNPELEITFGSQTDRDKWYADFRAYTTTMGLSITLLNCIEKSVNDGCRVKIKASTGIGSTGVYLSKPQVLGHFQPPRELAINLGDMQLRDYFASSFNLTSEHALIITQSARGNDALYFKNQVLAPQQNKTLSVEFHENANKTYDESIQIGLAQ